jgi:rod shape determining protein RodA
MATVTMPGRTLTGRRAMGTLRRNPRSPWRHVDALLIGCVAALAGLGALMIYSATRGVTEPFDLSFVKKQAMFCILGGLLMAGAASLDYRRLREWALPMYALSIFLLLAVLAVGSRQRGTQGWFQLGPFQLQPSEFAKLALILVLAYLGSHFRGDVGGRRFGAMLFVSALPMGLVMLQPDLGTTMVSGSILVSMLIVAGARFRQLLLLGVVAVGVVVVVLQSGQLDDYQQDRLTNFIKQDVVEDQRLSRGSSYNLNQSKIAIGSGGLFGKGLFEGTQTRLGNVPEQHTDFIFTAVGEELGLLGAASLLALFGVVVWRIWRAAQLARDDFGALICAGVLAMLVFQIFENVGMTMGIMPITGIPLPLLSYGGSSTLTTFAAIGLVLSVHMRRFS